MADDGKKLVISVGIDEQSSRRAREHVQGMLADVTKLTQEARKAVSVGGGALGPGGVEVTDGKSGGKSNGGVQKAVQEYDKLTKSVAKANEAFKNLKTTSETTVKVMAESAKRALGSEEQAIDRVAQKLQKLNQAYASRTTVFGAGAAGVSGTAAGNFQYVSASGAAGGAPARVVTGQGGTGGAVAGYIGGAGGGGHFGGGGASGSLPGSGPQGGGFMAGAGRFMSMAGRIGGLALMGGNLIGNELLHSNMMEGNVMANRAHATSSLYHAARAGDISTMRAIQDNATDPEAKRQLQELAASVAAQRASNLGSSVMSTLMGQGNIAQKMTDAQVMTDLFAKSSGNIEAQKISKPKQYEAEQYFMSNYAGRAQMMRALGLGYHIKKGSAGKTLLNGMNDLGAAAGGMGYSPDEAYSAAGSILGTGGRKASLGLALQVMAASGAGMGNAGHIAGMASMGGAGSDFMRTLFGGNVDITARGNVGSMVAQQMMAGGPMTSGQGLLGTAMNSFTSDNDVLRAHQLQAGMGAFGGLLGGGIDGYQRGRNTLSAINALGPGASSYAQDYLATKMTPALMAEIIRTGKVPQELADRGITLGAVHSFYNSTTKSSLERYIGQGGSDAQSRFAMSLKDSGMSPADYAKGQLNGLSGSAYNAKAEEFIRLYGGILSDTTGVDDMTGKGRAALELNLGKGFGKGWAPNAAKGSAEANAIMDRAAKDKELQDIITNSQEAIKVQTNLTTALGDRLDQFTKNLGAATDVAIDDILALGAAAAAATGQMNGKPMTPDQIKKHIKDGLVKGQEEVRNSRKALDDASTPAGAKPGAGMYDASKGGVF